MAVAPFLKICTNGCTCQMIVLWVQHLPRQFHHRQLVHAKSVSAYNAIQYQKPEDFIIWSRTAVKASKLTDTNVTIKIMHSNTFQ